MSPAAASCRGTTDWTSWIRSRLSADTGLYFSPVGPSGHSALPAGAHASFLRESCTAAAWLLNAGDPAEVPRIERMLARVAGAQDRDPCSPTHGVWPYYLEEPLSRMPRPDLNWADFIGSAMIDIAHHFGDRLSPALLRDLRDSIRHAAFAIHRRNVGADYTNIAAMAAAVALWSGENDRDPVLLDFGLRKLRALREKTEADGGFAEYNSPTYSTVLGLQFERVLRTVRHPAARADAQALLELNWTLIAEQFHLPTGQWAGAQSRSYAHWLEDFPARYIEERSGVALPRRPDPASNHFDLPFPFLPHTPTCPPGLLSRFQTAPASASTSRRVWNRFKDGRPGRVTSTWLDPVATLGSVSLENAGESRRLVQGFWRSDADVANRLRVRFLKDGRDTYCACIHVLQDGPRLLAAFHLLGGTGDSHPHWDRPADGSFLARDLRVRIEVEGAGAEAVRDAASRILLKAGGRKVVVHPGALFFAGEAGPGWELKTRGDQVAAEGVLLAGPARRFNPVETPGCLAAFGLELLHADEPAAKERLSCARHESVFRVAWSPLGELELPVLAPLEGDYLP